MSILEAVAFDMVFPVSLSVDFKIPAQSIGAGWSVWPPSMGLMQFHVLWA